MNSIPEPRDPSVYKKADEGIQQTDAVILWDKLDITTLQPMEDKPRKGLLTDPVVPKDGVHLLLQSTDGKRANTHDTTRVDKIEVRDEIVFRIHTRHSQYRLIICPGVPKELLKEPLDETIANIKRILEPDQESTS